MGKHPSRPCVLTCEGESFTFEFVDRFADRLADELCQHPQFDGEGTIVGISVERGVEVRDVVPPPVLL